MAITTALVGCDSKPAEKAGTGIGAKLAAAPKFVLAWSEYPSWSIFGVASDVGLIDGQAGKMGSIEKKYNVDIELKLVDYDSCITLYGNSQADAVCITNIHSWSCRIAKKCSDYAHLDFQRCGCMRGCWNRFDRCVNRKSNSRIGKERLTILF